MLLVVSQLPSGADAVARVATVIGHAASDVQRRLTGIPPRVLLSDADSARVQTLAEALTRDGFNALACDPARAPTDALRVVGHRLEPAPHGFAVVDRPGRRTVIPTSAIGFLQRGVRGSLSGPRVPPAELRPPSMRELLMNSRPQPPVARLERFLLVQRIDGAPDVILYETRVHYGFLGAEMSPTSLANFARMVHWLRRLAPAVALDDRAGQRAFIESLPTTGVDAVDLALYLVRLVAAPRLSPYRS